MRAEQVRVNQHQTSQFQLQNQYTQYGQPIEQMSQQYVYDSMSQHQHNQLQQQIICNINIS